ncbi:BolA family protein [Nitrosospira sp. Is2]|uniref:BolA family protein n=1 Tax=Nitrosospira sp. Is2 TaxID=3080532 RepID=UPI002952C13F|nr:BolA family protein [Nitrosospira sp. Is2]WON74585.1 BolA family protein [Nitrosospira sp. Is2]
MSDTTELIRQKLAALEPAKIDIIDDSARHAGHAGARGGGGHYSVTIVSCQFSGKTAVARHRLVYGALRELMHKDIHALSVKAYTPEESDLIH